MFLVLPLNYFGKKVTLHKQIHSENLDAFTIASVDPGSKWYDLTSFDLSLRSLCGHAFTRIICHVVATCTGSMLA